MGLIMMKMVRMKAICTTKDMGHKTYGHTYITSHNDSSSICISHLSYFVEIYPSPVSDINRK